MEVVVVTGIMVMSLGVIIGVYISGTNMWENTKEEADLQAQAREALSFMVGELRNATRISTQTSSPNASIPSSDSIHFHLPEYDVDGSVSLNSNNEINWDQSDTIIYDYIPGQKQLRRTEKGEHLILANNVADVTFQDITADSSLGRNEIKITISLQKTTSRQRDISVSLSSVVKLRN